MLNLNIYIKNKKRTFFLQHASKQKFKFFLGTWRQRKLAVNRRLTHYLLLRFEFNLPQLRCFWYKQSKIVKRELQSRW